MSSGFPAPIDTVPTPNPDAIMLKVQETLVQSGTHEFTARDDSENAPLAKVLLDIEGIQLVLIAPRFVTLRKSPSTDWPDLVPLAKQVLRDFLASGQMAVFEQVETFDPEQVGEIEKQIIHLLDEDIRPALAMDGGDIKFIGFENGVVTVQLIGAFALPAPTAPVGVGAPTGGKVRSSPAARAAARAKGINLALVQGTGPRGRITRADVLRHAAGVPAVGAPTVASVPPPRAVPLPTPEPGDTVVPNNNMRKTIAKRLKAAYADAPVFFLTAQFHCDALVEYRTRLKEGGAKVSYNDIMIAACAKALRDVPEVNAAWADENIIQRAKVDIGMAVALPGGLITPVIRDADKKALTDIAADTRSLVTKARDGKLAPTEYTGSTFTISNLGMKAIDQFTAIINPPEACILAVGSMQQEPVVEDGKLSIGWRMKVTLTCDHRVVDGALGADFLSAVRSYIEDPSKIGS